MAWDELQIRFFAISIFESPQLQMSSVKNLHDEIT